MIWERLQEPSTYAGLAGVALALGVSAPMWTAVTTAIAAIAGVIAVVVSEKSK